MKKYIVILALITLTSCSMRQGSDIDIHKVGDKHLSCVEIYEERQRMKAIAGELYTADILGYIPFANNLFSTGNHDRHNAKLRAHELYKISLQKGC